MVQPLRSLPLKNFLKPGIFAVPAGTRGRVLLLCPFIVVDLRYFPDKNTETRQPLQKLLEKIGFINSAPYFCKQTEIICLMKNKYLPHKWLGIRGTLPPPFFQPAYCNPGNSTPSGLRLVRCRCPRVRDRPGGCQPAAIRLPMRQPSSPAPVVPILSSPDPRFPGAATEPSAEITSFPRLGFAEQ